MQAASKVKVWDVFCHRFEFHTIRGEKDIGKNMLIFFAEWITNLVIFLAGNITGMTPGSEHKNLCTACIRVLAPPISPGCTVIRCSLAENGPKTMGFRLQETYKNT